MAASKKKQGKGAPQTLAEARTSYAKRLEKAERALTRLEKQHQKLRKAELTLAEQTKRHLASLAQLADQTSEQAATLERVYVIANPKSKRLADKTVRLETIVDELRAVGILAEIGLKTSGKVARLLARAAVERGDSLLIVAGGDGTIGDVATELVGSKTSLGILPVGTMNNLARALGVPSDIRAACQLLATRLTRRIDVGQVRLAEHEHEGYFLETAGVGLSALAAALGQELEKGHWLTLVSSLGQFLAFKPTQMRIQLDTGEQFQVEADMVTLSNSPFFGNHMLVAPAAKIDDGFLDLAIYQGMHKTDLERYFLELAQGRHPHDPRIIFRQARTVQIDADEALAANASLEVLPKQQHWAFSVAPRALSVVVGPMAMLTLSVAFGASLA